MEDPSPRTAGGAAAGTAGDLAAPGILADGPLEGPAASVDRWAAGGSFVNARSTRRP